MLRTASYVRCESLLRADLIQAKVVSIWEEMIRMATAELSTAITDKKQEFLVYEIHSSDRFMASHGWVVQFIARNRLSSRRGVCNAVQIAEGDLQNARIGIRKTLPTKYIHDVYSSDEVGLLYGSFPNRTVHLMDKSNPYECVQDRLAATLTVRASGEIAPLIIFGKSTRPRSFPMHFDAMEDVRMFYQSQQNPWNNPSLWARRIRGYSRMGGLQGRTISGALDSCSVHMIDDEMYPNYNLIFLPSNLTLNLRPVDSLMGRSCKCTFRKLLIEHILLHVDCSLQNSVGEAMPLKIKNAVTTFDATRCMACAWDLVLRCVVIKAWLCTAIPVPPHIGIVHGLVENSQCVIEPAVRPQIGSSTSIEASRNDMGALNARRAG